MDKQTNLLVFTGALLFSAVACNTATNLILQQPSGSLPQATPAGPSSTDETPADMGDSCRSVLSDIVTIASTSSSDAEPEQERVLVTYQVSGEQLTDPQFESIPAELTNVQQDLATQQKAWDYFTALVPSQERSMISTYTVITDGDANLLAAVSQTENDPSQWTLEVDIADAADYYNLTFTLIHEFGHLLTLNADQVPPDSGFFSRREHGKVHDLAASLCPSYYPGEGCSRNDSYLNQYYQRFWGNIYDEWNEIDQIQDENAYYERLGQFYTKYWDQFVTSYAATDPVEDIAETWAYFILTPRPEGDTLAEQKVLFFYEYPALINLREDIQGRLCTSFPDSNGAQ